MNYEFMIYIFCMIQSIFFSSVTINGPGIQYTIINDTLGNLCIIDIDIIVPLKAAYCYKTLTCLIF